MHRPTCFAGAAALLCVTPASAHVKWFADWSIVCPPRDPARVFSSSLWQAFFVAAVVTMAFMAWLDARLTRPGSRALAISDTWHARIAPQVPLVLRVGLALYWLLAALGLPQTVYLTPELTAPAWVTAVQLACAVLVLGRRSSVLAGFGLLGLYAAAVIDHGWFHLLDYPVFAFIGVALVAPGFSGREHAERTLALLRWGAGITLLWGGVEKLAYPEWSFAMLSADTTLSLGVSPETAMFMYGYGEMAMAFGLLLFGVGGQVASALLLAVFIAAVPAFGWLDLVGHSGIIVVLALLTVTRGPQPLRLRMPAWHIGVRATLFPCTVVALCSGYFALHALYLPGAPVSQLVAASTPKPTPSTARGVTPAALWLAYTATPWGR